MRALLPVCLVLVLAADAAAQLGPPPPSSRWAPSPDQSMALSVGVPVVTVGAGYLLADTSPRLALGLATAGLVFGPSAGTAAQGAWGDAMLWTGVRAAGLAAAVSGAGLAWTDDQGQAVAAYTLMGVGTVAYAVGTARDVAAGRAHARSRATLAPGGGGLALRVAL